MNTIIEKIRAEVERRKKAIHSTLFNDEYNDFLSFLSDLEKECEKPTPAKGLEEEIEREWNDCDGKHSDTDYHIVELTKDDFLSIARHFAQWQKQHDAELIEIAYNDGITIGMTKQKEQMMKEAVEGWVARDGFDNTLCFFSNKPHRPDIQEPLKVWKMWLGGCFHLPKQLFPDLKWEDEPKKVKLIIVKEDKQ